MMIETKLLKSNTDDDLNEVVDLLSKGELVAVPTETVYGLAGDAKNTDAVKKIFTAKNRPRDHPLIVHIASFEQLSDWVRYIPESSKALASAFWPGPLTIVFNKKKSVNNVVTGGLETIAIRVPNEPSLLKVLHKLNTGLAAPSANTHKRISPTAASHVLETLNGKIAAVLDSGDCTIGLESTILDLTTEVPTILRPGPISKKNLESIMGVDIKFSKSENKKIPGNMKIHYQPRTRSFLMDITEINKIISDVLYTKHLFGVIHISKLSNKNLNVRSIKMPRTKTLYAKSIYRSMHELDKIKPFKILIETPPKGEDWIHIHDKLSKATNNPNLS